MQTTDDTLLPFQLENHAAQGRMVRLGDALNQVLTAHQYPDAVAMLLGEVQVITALMSGALKFDGVMSIQVKGEGPVSMLLVDVTADGNMRGYARFDSKQLQIVLKNGAGGPQQGIPQLLGNGYFSLTVDQGPDTQPYQGVVPLEGATLTEIAHGYLRQSAQLDAALKIAVSHVRVENRSIWRGGGIMVQKSAFAGFQGVDGESTNIDFEDAWRRAVIFLASATDDELLDESLHPHDFLFRLFSEDGVRAFDPSPFAMKCRCSIKRIQNVLASFPLEEIQSMKVGDDIVVTCEFCNVDYRIDADKIDKIFEKSAPI